MASMVHARLIVERLTKGALQITVAVKTVSALCELIVELVDSASNVVNVGDKVTNAPPPSNFMW
jgi:hypothetical protein